MKKRGTLRLLDNVFKYSTDSTNAHCILKYILYEFIPRISYKLSESIFF